MSRFLEIGVVAGGYGAAFLIASAAVAVRIANTSGPEAQASSGMYAFGDAFLFAAVFSLLAVVPTGAALLFLRPYRRFWTMISALALLVSSTGIIATILYVGWHAMPSPLTNWARLSPIRILVAPFLALTFLVSTGLAPYRSARLLFLAATLMEAAVSAYAGVAWFLPLVFQNG